MVIISYLSRTPRYENITFKDIKLMDKYFAWQARNERNPDDICTFNKYCSHDESELPSKEILAYFKQFSDNLIEEVARIPKTNQIDNWFIKNVMNGTRDEKYHEVTKEQLEELFKRCHNVLEWTTAIGDNQFIVDNAEIAQKYLPIMENWFYGVDEYNSMYVIQIKNAMEQIESVLRTTDFEEQAIWYMLCNENF